MESCYFDDGQGVCHASKEDECPYDYDTICTAKLDVYGNVLGTPDGCYDE